ncbi:MAG: 2-amino-4-hydroxy-6-hydroxymethyldihydropteridine diphosphokinase [Ignavibacteriae bacterium]|nr:MAG: 2-amino-4-hydroxy-6-hydroxymethyldihydropteridine diphosphokinase [Ignavibacteriota bacterium]
MLEKVILGFGSNVGNRFLNIEKAIENIHFSSNFSILAISPVYETEPWGFKNQNNFLNCVIVILCRLKPSALLIELKNIEKKIGRQKREKWKQREIDIDILFYGSKVYKSKILNIPHPQLQDRYFVLKPLADLIPGLVHPVSKKKVKDILRTCKDKGRVILYKKQLLK